MSAERPAAIRHRTQPRYPVTGPASFIACPRHGLAVALGEDGRIVSTCPACVRVATAAVAVVDQWKEARK